MEAGKVAKNRLRRLLLLPACIVLFAIYTFGIWSNPPSFFVDESALCYNAYLVAETGAGEFGPRFPLYFQVYSRPFTQWSNPTQIYLLALLFKIFGPGILSARLLAAACVFAASLLLGLLAQRISGVRLIGVIVGAAALLTPWLFEVGRLVLETFFYPMAVVLLLWSVYRASEKRAWSYLNTAAIVGALVLLTYSYTIGRLLGPLLAFGLVIFATDRKRIFSVLKVWALFAVTLVPLALHLWSNPQLTKRFNTLSYIEPGRPYIDIAFDFVRRFLEDVNPYTLLMVGDTNPRHHQYGALGSFYTAVFVLSVMGVVLIFLRHRRDPWWLFVVYGLAASAVPGALTVDAFHTLRMIAYPVFLLMLTVPGLTWLLEERRTLERAETAEEYWQTARGLILTAVLVFGAVEAFYFHLTYYRFGPLRGAAFDQGYRTLYQEALSQPDRPIYLADGYYGPMYIHSLWYATVEGRDLGEFVHMQYGARAPRGAIVLSSEERCEFCEMIAEEDDIKLYRTK